MLTKDSTPLTTQQIVQAGLCIGCGLCQSVIGQNRLALVLTPEGRERPVPADELSAEEGEIINAICPGLRVEGSRQDELEPGTPIDTIWGPAAALAVGYAGNHDIRHRCSSGGILTALGQYLLSSGRVDFILHVKAKSGFPMRTEQTLSFDVEAVLEAAGSRYGPASPLIDFEAALALERPFAVLAKPCDVNAIRNLSRLDERVARYLRYTLVFVCGGASDLTKSEEVLRGFGIAEDELRLFRYRGHGNPGLTRVETAERTEALTYQDMWAEESRWMIQPRCKICPDAIGEAADIAASDFWPGGSPTAEDDGFNGIIVRTARGRELYEAAMADGAIVIDRVVSFRDFDVMQPHQLRKKRAIWARYRGMTAAGLPVPETINLRIDACARHNDLATNLREARVQERVPGRGRLGETLPRRRDIPEF